MHRPVDSFWVSTLSSAACSSTAKLRGWLAVAALLLLSGCATFAPSPPEDQTNICEIFREQPSWYDYAKESEEKKLQDLSEEIKKASTRDESILALVKAVIQMLDDPDKKVQDTAVRVIHDLKDVGRAEEPPPRGRRQ